MASASPKNIIEGLQLFVHGNELKTLCNKRVAYHQERAKFYEGEMARHKEMVERLRPQQAEFERLAEEQNKGLSTYSRADPINLAQSAMQSADGSAKHHKAKAVFFTFFAEHLDLESTYKLDEDDLRKLEVL